MLRLYHSNRLEALAALLAERLRSAPGDPLEAERIVVAHPSMARWLTLEIADTLGIAANLRFELPADFAWSIMRAALPGLGGERAYTPSRLRWRIYDTLPGFAAEEGEPSVAPVRGYLSGGGARERFELAERLARVFDRCLLYRPDWIREWERGPAPHWQARLWQRLVEADAARAPGGRPPGHWVASIDAFRDALAQAPPAEWPRRVCFFAVPALSPSYLEVLHAASAWLSIHLLAFNPCREYWGDIRSQRAGRLGARGADPAAHHFSAGNELLAAWGRAARDTIDTFVEAEATGAAESIECFVPPETPSRLAAVQRDILELRLADEAAGAWEAGETATEGQGIPGAGGRAKERVGADDSLQIHICHSALREAEVLHDRLLDLFDAHPEIAPADVLVLVPDLARYGPAIEAVFGAAERIPCKVARVRSSDSRAVRAFLDLLALPRSRYPAEAVLAPLGAAAVRVRFGLEEADLPVIRAWLREAGVRWGVDAAHLGAERLPRSAEHTWREGLRRLLLGYAVTGGAEDLVAGLVPCTPLGAAGFEPGPVEHDILGRFLTYCEAAFALRALADGVHDAAEWAERLRGVVARFFATDTAAPAPGAATFSSLPEDAEAVRGLVRGLEEEAGSDGRSLPFEVIRDALRERADELSSEAARLADGVRVTRLAAGAIFPAQVVCVAGLNGGEFPRSASPLTFDLVAAGPARRGDRDPRYEDRLAFLEALLAARRAFLVFYTGRALRDDATLPPSVVVDELRDYLARRFPGVSFETRHPLQPFSPRYFEGAGADDEGGGGALFSYSAGMCRAAEVLRGAGSTDPAPARFDTPLPAPDPARRRVALGTLVDFFAHPTRALLRGRLGLRLEDEAAALDEEAPFEIEGLERYRLRSTLWERMQEGAETERAEAMLRGSGRLPPGSLGRVTHERAWEEMQGLRVELEPWRGALAAPPLRIDLALAGFRVEGEIDPVGPLRAEPARSAALAMPASASAAGGIPPRERAWWRIGKLRARDRIAVWLRQLALAAAGHPPAPACALTLEQGSWKTTRFEMPEREEMRAWAREELTRWLEAWWQGLSAPLPFFPETSWAYAAAIAKELDRHGQAELRGEALRAAKRAWRGTPYTRAEKEDPYLALACEEHDPTEKEAFQTLATTLLLPALGWPDSPLASDTRDRAEDAWDDEEESLDPVDDHALLFPWTGAGG